MSTPKPSFLEQLQLDIAARLSSLEEFTGITINVVRPRSEAEAALIQTTIDNVLAGMTYKDNKAGAAVIISVPIPEAIDEELPGPQLEPVIRARVIENPLVNMGELGTKLSAEQICLNLLHSLHHWDPGTGNGPLRAEKKPMEPVENYPGKVVYDCLLRTRHGLDPAIKVATPIVTQNSALPTAGVTMSCLTPGASIYYTTDGSLPWPGNEAASLYQNSFELAEAVTLRAAAYKAGVQGSDINQTEIN